MRRWTGDAAGGAVRGARLVGGAVAASPLGACCRPDRDERRQRSNRRRRARRRGRAAQIIFQTRTPRSIRARTSRRSSEDDRRCTHGEVDDGARAWCELLRLFALWRVPAALPAPAPGGESSASAARARSDPRRLSSARAGSAPTCGQPTCATCSPTARRSTSPTLHRARLSVIAHDPARGGDVRALIVEEGPRDDCSPRVVTYRGDASARPDVERGLGVQRIRCAADAVEQPASARPPLPAPRPAKSAPSRTGRRGAEGVPGPASRPHDSTTYQGVP